MQYFDLHTHQSNQDENVVAVLNHFWGAPLASAFASMGQHPMHIQNFEVPTEIITRLCAIGESGLDKRSSLAINRQIQIFEQQIELSELHKKPLIIHCVRAFQELIQLKKHHQPQMPWIMHGFRKNSQLAHQLASEDFYLSFGAGLFLQPEIQKNVLSQIPLSHIFLETDEQNTYNIQQIYAQAALLLNVELPILKAQIWQNLKTCQFPISDSFPRC